MKEIFIELLNFFGLAFWVEIITDTPKCTYYFGPFLNKKEAEDASKGYIDDLKEESAVGIATYIKRMKPAKLTIFDEVEDTHSNFKVKTIKSQAF